jgi:2-methylcitrate dehydratase
MAGDPEKWRPGNRETADHSMPYTAAVALKYGSVKPEHFEERYFRDKELLELTARVKCSPSEEADRRELEMTLCDLEVTLHSGERRAVRTEYHSGHWRNPMSDAEMEEKFRALASHQLPAARVDALAAQLWKLETLSDAGELVRLSLI